MTVSAKAKEPIFEDRIDLSEYLTPRPENAILVRIEGSMPDIGAFSGDTLIAERGVNAHAGDIIIAQKGDHFTVERFHGILTLAPWWL